MSQCRCIYSVHRTDCGVRRDRITPGLCVWEQTPTATGIRTGAVSIGLYRVSYNNWVYRGPFFYWVPSRPIKAVFFAESEHRVFNKL